MENGWVKLHRKILENKFLTRDTNAFKVFITLLLLVDRKTGVWEGGRFQLAGRCGLKPTTFYAASARLVKAKMMTLSSNNKYSTYTVSNWATYQSNGNNNDDNKMTTRRQQDDTLTRSKKLRSKENPAEVELIKFLKKQPKINNPEGYLSWLKGKYGSEHLHRLSKISFNEWQENLEHWNNS